MPGKPVKSLGKIAFVLFFVSLTAGCAFCDLAGEVPGMSPSQEEYARKYSRNTVVALPTMIGNSVGAVPGVAIGLPAELIASLFGEKYAQKVFKTVLGWSTHIFGFITGTPFLPISYIFPKDPWTLFSKCSGKGGFSLSKIHADCYPEMEAQEKKAQENRPEGEKNEDIQHSR